MVEALDHTGKLLSIFLPGLEQGISLGDLPVNIRGSVRINQIQDRNPISASDIVVCLIGEEKVKFIKGHKHQSGGYRKKYKDALPIILAKYRLCQFSDYMVPEYGEY